MALVAIGVLGWRLHSVQQELVEVAQSARSQNVLLTENLDDVQSEISGIREELQTTLAKADMAETLSERLLDAERNLGDIGEAIEAQASTLSVLEKEREAFGPQVLERELNQRDERLLRRWDALSQLVSSAQESASESQKQLQELDAALTSPRDLHRMWKDLVGPVVQLAGDTSVGSGVLLESEEDSEDGDFRTYLITAWHVVRDIQGDLSRQDMPVPVNIYGEDGSIRHEEADLLCFDPELDAALLELRTPDRLDNGASPASFDRLGEVKIFDRVYAVGCPLGNDPIPTYGEIATVQHMVEGETYWMINAPTYIGNSGGGIFDSDTHELLGIFSKIYTHGTLRPTIVPHMGLVTPLSAIYEWLEGEGYALEQDSSGRAKVAAVER